MYDWWRCCRGYHLPLWHVVLRVAPHRTGARVWKCAVHYRSAVHCTSLQSGDWEHPGRDGCSVCVMSNWEPQLAVYNNGTVSVVSVIKKKTISISIKKMGASQVLPAKLDIRNVLFHDNGCALAPYISSVIGLGSGTASTSDQWLITLTPDRLTYRNKPLQKVFVKIIPNIENHPAPILNYALTLLKKEVRIYAEIIKPLIDKKICPFFLPVINVSETCTGESLVEMLQNKAPSLDFVPKPMPDGFPMEKTFIAKEVFVRNMVMSAYYYHIPDYRSIPFVCFDQELELEERNKFSPPAANLGYLKAFTTDTPVPKVLHPHNQKCIMDKTYAVMQSTYTLLYTEPVEGGETCLTLVKKLLNKGKLTQIYFIFFQITMALGTMSFAKIYHKDLHSNNVLIKALGQKEKFTYLFENYLYVFTTNKIPLVFDFDRSEVQQLQTAEMLDSELFMFDLWAFFMDWYDYVGKKFPDLKDSFQDTLLTALFGENKEEVKEYWDSLLKDPQPHLQDYVRENLIGPYMMDLTLSWNDIVHNWSKAAAVPSFHKMDQVQQVVELMKQGTPENTFYLTQGVFDATTGQISYADPQSFIHEYVQVFEQQVSDPVPGTVEQIIAKKQELAMLNLEMLQLQLLCEKNPTCI